MIKLDEFICIQNELELKLSKKCAFVNVEFYHTTFFVQNKENYLYAYKSVTISCCRKDFIAKNPTRIFLMIFPKGSYRIGH